MRQIPRREFLRWSVATPMVGWSATLGRLFAEETTGKGLQLAPFRYDVTPPIGHSCCGGWIPDVSAVDDSLEAIGFVLLGAEKPIVLCAVDWTGLLNAAHLEWRTALAEGAGTTPDRVAVHCVHQHNAPLACLSAESLVAAQGDLPHVVDIPFFRQCLERGRVAVSTAIRQAQPLTHIATGQGRVDRVASNRRISRDENGRVKAMRGSACKDPDLRDMPEGIIDPWLKTVAFYNGLKKVVACHYYATHPMSYYGDGRVTSDFVGLARKQHQRDNPDAVHIYFTGCAGNVSAGKYNDGSKEARPILASRILDGMRAAEKELKPEPIGRVRWQALDMLPTPRDTLDAAVLKQQIADRKSPVVGRNRPAYELSWLNRLEQQVPLVLSSLRMNDVSLLHLPAECFIEYQLRAQQMRPNGFIATAAYGDGGPWYVPIKEEYPNGGYEVSVAFCAPTVDDVLTSGMKKLLAV
jgi:hypothetical protein